jgi:hypothetical protein
VIQAVDRTAPILPMTPTTPARMTHDYVRHGTTGLFAALDLFSGSLSPSTTGATGTRSACASSS